MDVDALIVELVESGRQATDGELSHIVAHVAQASFASRPVRISPRLRDELAVILGKPVDRRLPSIEFHLLKRIHLEQQWPVGTTAKQYLTDLHLAVRHPAARIWTYKYRAEPMVDSWLHRRSRTHPNRKRSSLWPTMHVMEPSPPAFKPADQVLSLEENIND